MTRDDVLWLGGVVIAGVGIFAAICVRHLSGMPRHLARRLLLAIAVYLLQGAVVIAILIYLYPALSHTPAAARGYVFAMLGWLGLAARLLMRMLPSEFWRKEKPKPQWMQRFGIIDIPFLLALAGGAAAMAGLI
jgi:hypothetical protein